MRLLTLFSIILIAIQTVLLADVTVSARLNPPRVALGSASQYIIEIVEHQRRGQEFKPIDRFPFPSVDGIRLSNPRISINQEDSTNTPTDIRITQSIIVDASASRTGDFIIPAYEFTYRDQRLRVPPATLQVVEREADANPGTDELIFLKADLPDTLYLGQTIAFDLKLHTAENVRLRGLNDFDRKADGFTISQLPEDFSEGVETIKGRRYRTITWPFTLTPIQTGEQEMNFQFGVTARLPGQQSPRESFGQSPFGGSLFEEFFGRSERLNVFTPPIKVDIRPLPDQGQPESFSGAIGDFALEVSSDGNKVNQGEPVMLSIVIKGSGNFERIKGPKLPESEDWRSYDPETKFNPTDKMGLSGSKRFDYVFVPQRSGSLQLPEIRFSYFDPDEAEYVELTAPPIQVEVSPVKTTSTPIPESPGNSAIQSNDLELSKTLSSEEALLTLDYRPEPSREVGYGILNEPAFIIVNILAGLAIAAGAFGLAYRKRCREDPRYPIRSAATQALKESRQGYQAAFQQNNAEAFFRHGQSAIRAAATVRTGHTMQSADISELESLLGPESADECRAFFESANANRFGGSKPNNLDTAKTQLENILKTL